MPIILSWALLGRTAFQMIAGRTLHVICAEVRSLISVLYEIYTRPIVKLTFELILKQYHRKKRQGKQRQRRQ